MKSRSTSFLFACLIGIVLLSSCTSRNNQNPRIDLSKDWEYSLQNPELEKAVFHPLENEKLQSLESMVPDQYGSIWLKKEFTLPSDLMFNDISCYLGRITFADKTYLNGIMIGHEGFFPPYEFSAWNTVRLYDIPEEILVAGKNTLLIEVFVNAEGSIVSGPFIGLHDDAKYHADLERFWNSGINALFAFMMVIIGLFSIMIYIRNRNAREHLYFMVMNICTALYMSVFFLYEIPGHPVKGMSFLWFQKIFSSGLPFVLPFLITAFVNAFFKRKENIIMMILRVLCVAGPIVLIMTTPDYIHLRALRTYTQPILALPVLYALGINIVKVFKKEKEAIPLLLGFSPFGITVLLDVILHDWFGYYNLPYLSSIGWQLVILALLLVLVNRFSNARKEAEYLNLHLQDEVEKQTKELSESNNKLSVANHELEKSRIRAEQDMKLAVFVQQSFYPRSVPDVTDWDVAYTFKPMAGVSGDLYDFFISKKELHGVALFDVSGHGIASGLVTMLAKNIISRKFTSDTNKKLNRVMTEINDTLVKEKGNVENYLTGLLIRLADNQVEYINAGHPTVFYRSGATGKVHPVEGKNSSAPGAGGIVGIDGLSPEFKTLKFKMNKGDSLIMYTDCLSESRNTAGEEFGTSRIADIFAACTGDNAQQKMNEILSEFENFTKGVDLKDDLTVIVLQKK